MKKRLLGRIAAMIVLVFGACAAVFAKGTSDALEVGTAAGISVNPTNAVVAACLMVLIGIGIFTWRNGIRH